jgi:hypothetical protein
VEDERSDQSRGDLAGSPGRSPADTHGSSGWVTTKVAAEALGVNPRTVRAYIARGDLEAKSEGEGIQKTYLVSIDSLYTLRDRRGPPRSTRGGTREESARHSTSAGPRGGTSGGIPAEELTGMIRELTADLLRKTADVAELRTRLELTAQAESTLQAERERLLEDVARERARADRFEAELDTMRKAQERTPEPRDAPEAVSEGADKEDVPSEPQEPTQRRSWLYRFFFGP